MILDILPPETSSGAASVKGLWCNIRWIPNDTTGEILNIGVLFKASDGPPHVKMLESFDRLSCLYDAKLASHAKFLIQVTKEALLANVSVPTESVFLSEAKFASGVHVLSILDELFYSTVPLGAPRNDLALSYASAPDRLLQPFIDSSIDARAEVLFALRNIAGMKADRIISSEKAMQVAADDGRVHHLDIPLQTSSALGTIVSARYVRSKDNELNLLRADSDLQIARRIYTRDRLFMYVVRPLHEKNAERADRLFEEFTWKFRQVGVAMKSYTQPELVAQDILEDMPSV